MNEKTYDGQTASFLAAVATCMPRDMSCDIMQGWIDNPKSLQKVLMEALLPSQIDFCKSRRVDNNDGTISFFIIVDRLRSPKQVLDATGRKQYTNSTIVESMPKGEGDEVEVVFFKLDRWVNDNDLEKEYEKRGLIPADPYSLATVNEIDPSFADEHSNGTHWKDSDDKWCYAAFSRWYDGLGMDVSRYDSAWNDGWWFAGLRK